MFEFSTHVATRRSLAPFRIAVNRNAPTASETPLRGSTCTSAKLSFYTRNARVKLDTKASVFLIPTLPTQTFSVLHRSRQVILATSVQPRRTLATQHFRILFDYKIVFFSAYCGLGAIASLKPLTSLRCRCARLPLGFASLRPLAPPCHLWATL